MVARWGVDPRPLRAAAGVGGYDRRVAQSECSAGDPPRVDDRLQRHRTPGVDAGAMTHDGQPSFARRRGARASSSRPNVDRIEMPPSNITTFLDALLLPEGFRRKEQVYIREEA